MQIRRVDIDNFRGIRSLSWRLPAGRSFVTLIGPGDSGKSTILSAIDMALSDRWNLAFTDSDFFEGDVGQRLSIKVALTDLTPDLARHPVLGLHLSGMDLAGEWFEDPADEHDACLIITLGVGPELEPSWTIHRPGKEGDEHPVTAAGRRLLGAFKVDERVDAHLRWSRASALTRITEATHGTNVLLTHAARTARQAVTDSVPRELAALTDRIMASLRAYGVGDLSQLQAGLDQSLSNASGNLALYEGKVPLTSFGLGSRRLAGMATQQLAREGETILLVDEVEYGLEPHRLIGLLTELKKPGKHSHVVASTHAGLVLQHLDIADLAIVRNRAGVVTVEPLAEGDGDLQGVLRAAPNAFLARKVVVTEGKTEYGIGRAVLERSDAARVALSQASSAALGVAIVESSGGSIAIHRAKNLSRAGYDVVLFIDSDVAADRAAADSVAALGVTVIRWAQNRHTERAATEVLDVAGLTSLIDQVIKFDDHPDQAPNNVRQSLIAEGLPKHLDGLDVATWIAGGYTLEKARATVANAAHKSGWFKRVDKGKVLYGLMVGGAHFDDSDTAEQLALLVKALYSAPGVAEPDRAPRVSATS